MTERNPTVVFTAPGQVEIDERPVPVPADGELLVRSKRTLISTGTELTILDGGHDARSKWGQYSRFPFVPGYDHIGEVVAVGGAADGDWLGKTVASYGSHAAYICPKADAVRPVQHAIPDEQAVFFTLAEIAMNGVRRGAVTWGEYVAVFGLGLVGQLAARFCHLAGATVLGVDPAPLRRDLLADGARLHTLDPQATDISAAVRERTRGRMADAVFEVTGAPEAIADQLESLRQQGRMVILSSPKGPTARFDFHDLCNAPSFTIIGAHNSSHPSHPAPGAFTQKRHAELFFDLVADGEIDVAPLISHRVSFNEAPALYQLLREDRTQAMGVVLEWDISS